MGESVESEGCLFSLFLAWDASLVLVASLRFLFDFGRDSSPFNWVDDGVFSRWDAGSSLGVLSFVNLAEKVLRLVLVADRGASLCMEEELSQNGFVGECGLSMAMLPLGCHC